MRSVIILMFLFLLLAPLAASAFELELDYPRIPGTEKSLDELAREEQLNLGKIIQFIYFTVVGISGLAAFAMIVWGGLQYLASTGNPAMTQEAVSRLRGAVVGLLVVLSSFLILNTINPDFVNLNPPTPESILEQLRAREIPPLQTLPPPAERSTFTVNGADEVQVGPGEPFVLAWDIPAAGGCSAGGGTAEWQREGVDEKTGSRIFSLEEPGTYTFRLECGQAFSSSVAVVVAAGTLPAPPQDLAVVLNVLGGVVRQGGPNQPLVREGAKAIAFGWEATNFPPDSECSLTQLGAGVNKEVMPITRLSRTTEFTFSGTIGIDPERPTKFTLVCKTVNTSPLGEARDEVVIRPQ